MPLQKQEQLLEKGDIEKYSTKAGRVHPSRLTPPTRKRRKPYEDIAGTDMFGRSIMAGDIVVYCPNTVDKRIHDSFARLCIVNELGRDEDGTIHYRMTMYKNACLNDIDEIVMRNTTVRASNRLVRLELDDLKGHCLYGVIQVARQRLAIQLAIPKIKNRSWRTPENFIKKAIEETNA